MEEMKKRLVDAIKGCNELCRECDRKGCEGCFLLSEYDKEADALLAAGVLVPPVKLGDTVYAVVDLDEPEICEYAVGGFEYSGGEWYVSEGKSNDEFFKVGGQLCLLTREEAEELVREMRRKRDENGL